MEFRQMCFCAHSCDCCLKQPGAYKWSGDIYVQTFTDVEGRLTETIPYSDAMKCVRDIVAKEYKILDSKHRGIPKKQWPLYRLEFEYFWVELRNILNKKFGLRLDYSFYVNLLLNHYGVRIDGDVLQSFEKWVVKNPVDVNAAKTMNNPGVRLIFRMPLDNVVIRVNGEPFSIVHDETCQVIAITELEKQMFRNVLDFCELVNAQKVFNIGLDIRPIPKSKLEHVNYNGIASLMQESKPAKQPIQSKLDHWNYTGNASIMKEIKPARLSNQKNRHTSWIDKEMAKMAGNEAKIPKKSGRTSKNPTANAKRKCTSYS